METEGYFWKSIKGTTVYGNAYANWPDVPNFYGPGGEFEMAKRERRAGVGNMSGDEIVVHRNTSFW